MSQIFRLVLGAPLLLAIVGCGGNSYQPVKGQVVYPDNTPAKELDGGEVIFQTKTADGKVLTATGPIDANGQFVLGTDAPQDGAAIGKHQVLIAPPTSTGDIPIKNLIDRKYEKFETSGIEKEVVKGENNITITVEQAPKR